MIGFMDIDLGMCMVLGMKPTKSGFCVCENKTLTQFFFGVKNISEHFWPAPSVRCNYILKSHNKVREVLGRLPITVSEDESWERSY